MKRKAIHRERQAAIRSLERQHQDRQCRPVQEQDKQPQYAQQRIAAQRGRHHSSFLMSTIRRIAAIIISTIASSTTALAQAAGYCSNEIWLEIIRPTEALCPPLISRT